MEKKTNEETLEVTYDGDPFTMFPNDLLINSDIHPNTRLLYGIIKHFITIPDFVLYKSTLIKALGLNENTFDKYWGQLKELGYLEQTKKHINGRYKYSYKLHSSSSKIQDPKIWGVVQDPKKQGLEKQGGKKIGEFNNKDSNNNYLNNINKNLDSSSEIPNETKDELINYEGMDLTDDQYYQIEKLIKEALVGKIDASKGNVISYCQKRYDSSTRTFKKKNGDEIKSIYGYVKSTFRIKAEQDKLKESSSQSSSFY